MSEKRTVDLSTEQVRFIDGLVASGGYASASEVVDAGLNALKEREGAIERWLREEVAPVYDAMQADPGRGIPAEEVESRLRARHAEHRKKGSHGA